MQNYENIDRELGWDDEISQESEFILAPEGDYDFVVEGFERSRFPGSEKMPACNCANVKIRIETAQGPTFITHRLMLHTRTEWALSAFFAAIGQKKKGEKLNMNWNLVAGSTGRCKVGIRQYNGNDYNEIKKFYAKEEKTFTPGRF